MPKIQFNFNDLDTSVRPQDDFFKFAGGGWLKRNPIPETESIWSRFHLARQESLKKTHAIFKELALKKNLKKGSEAQMVRDFYLSGMDMKTRNALGIAPIQDTLKRIQNIQTRDDLIEFIFTEHTKGGDYLWGHFVGQDDKNNEKYIFHLTQGGLTLPDRDYYLKSDPRSTKIRKAFRTYIKKLLVLAGTPTKEAARHANTILSLETKLARISMNRTDARDIDKVYNNVSVTHLMTLAPDIPWKQYFKMLGVSTKVRRLLVPQPNYLKNLNTLLSRVPLETWKTYLYFTTIDDAAPHLSETYVDHAFAFHGKVLAGSKKMKPLWKRVAAVLDTYIGQAVGKEYVKRYFPPEAKKKISDLVDDLFVAYEKRMRNVDWMTPKTKKRALKKLHNMTRKLGYPDKWKSYRGLVIKPNTYFENIERTEAFEHRKNLQKLGKKVDKKEWFTPPQTVNAFYDPNNNEIVFPAGILQPPFFDPDGDDAFNYGCMGSVIGHEMTHGFDDSGSKFDEKANYKEWWSEKDKKQFKRRAQVLVRQFNQFKVDGLPVNGKLTLGENIADLGGLEIAYDALKIHMEKKKLPTIKGFTPEQRFFLGLTLFETAHLRKELAHMFIIIDPHSPAKYRVNGPFSNMDSFYETFDVQPGDNLYRAPKDRAKIW